MSLYYRKSGTSYQILDYLSGPGWTSIAIRRGGTVYYIPVVTNLSHTYASSLRVRKSGATYAVLSEAGCTCNATCYLYSCACNATCYQYYACVCNATCYGYTIDPKLCATCYNICYGQNYCTCDATCYTYVPCSCDNTCYGYGV